MRSSVSPSVVPSASAAPSVSLATRVACAMYAQARHAERLVAAHTSTRAHEPRSLVFYLHMLPGDSVPYVEHALCFASGARLFGVATHTARDGAYDLATLPMLAIDAHDALTAEQIERDVLCWHARHCDVDDLLARVLTADMPPQEGVA